MPTPKQIIEKIEISSAFDAKKTHAFHERLCELADGHKAKYAINWRMPHTLFNISSEFWPNEDFAGIDWFAIYKSRYLGYWSNGNNVIVQAL